MVQGLWHKKQPPPTGPKIWGSHCSNEYVTKSIWCQHFLSSKLDHGDGKDGHFNCETEPACVEELRCQILGTALVVHICHHHETAPILGIPVEQQSYKIGSNSLPEFSIIWSESWIHSGTNSPKNKASPWLCPNPTHHYNLPPQLKTFVTALVNWASTIDMPLSEGWHKLVCQAKGMICFIFRGLF